MLAEISIKPLNIWSLGLSDHTSCLLKKKNIIGRVKTTVKKYLAHVIWKKDISELKYLAIVSIKGSMAHANKL